MADLASHANPDRDVEQALITLKKGTQLIKYSRKGKPKFCPFRISTDETTLIWYSHGEERNLKLSSVSRIIPGQRTAVFRRYLRPEKDYLSFSLLYKNGERSLDLICKDKVEADVWLVGLKALISTGNHSRQRTRSDFSDINEGDYITGRPFGTTLDFSPSVTRGRLSVDSRESLNLASSDVGSERANMQLRTSTGDGFRISVSSTPSCSSGGSGPDDAESLGDVYVWGEVWADVVLPDGPFSTTPITTKIDVLSPKPLDTNIVLDVHQIACGVRHVALVTRQGEVFTWGEESGGRLGHGIDKDFSGPHLVEFLAVTNVDLVACGEYHTCAVSTSGDFFTWGDGTYNAGLLGHGTDVSHWIPKRVSGFLEGLQVLSIACGTWHSAMATSNGKLFTFGDGKFGALGHGDRESTYYPREVQSLNGLKTIKVSCGVWHTAAIIEVMSQYGTSISSRKLFTWGDGDKYRLGHGSKDTYLLPTCISSLIDYNFHQLACGHTMTVALTTSGHVFTMGATAYGQLGNPSSDGKVPCLVQDKLIGEFVEEISCGAYHVALLTSRSEVFTWGRGMNGRLGHGDTEDRKFPTLVEALKDRHVKSISCGSNFTTSICTHKWVSGLDQNSCMGCRQAFGFTRKRHNCYNCGQVHCHGCSSKKALRAALAPTPGKPHRVCDACYSKLKAAEAGNASNVSKKISAPYRSIDIRDRTDRVEAKSSRILLSPNTQPVRYYEVKSGRPGTKTDYGALRSSQVPSLLQLKDIAFPSSLSALQNALKPVATPTSQLAGNSRPASPYSRRPSPPRSVTPVFSKGVPDSLKKTNELLNQEMAKLKNQVINLKQKCDAQDVEIQKLQSNFQEATLLAAEKSSMCTTFKEVMKSITAQLKSSPPEIQESDTFKEIHAQVKKFLCTSETRKLDSHNESSNLQDQKMGGHEAGAGGSDLSQNGGQISSHESVPQKGSENGQQSPEEPEKEVIEQFEPGVYITCKVGLKTGIKRFKQVRFSKRKFESHQAEEWWNKNSHRVYRRYRPPNSNPASTQSRLPTILEGSSRSSSTASVENNEAGAMSSNTPSEDNNGAPLSGLSSTPAEESSAVGSDGFSSVPAEGDNGADPSGLSLTPAEENMVESEVSSTLADDSNELESSGVEPCSDEKNGAEPSLDENNGVEPSADENIGVEPSADENNVAEPFVDNENVAQPADTSSIADENSEA